jgi:hypothetical protein
VVARFRVGEFEPQHGETSVEWAYETIQERIGADVSDEQIEALINELVELGRTEEKWELDAGALRKAMHDRRDEMTDPLTDAPEGPAPSL